MLELAVIYTKTDGNYRDITHKSAEGKLQLLQISTLCFIEYTRPFWQNMALNQLYDFFLGR